MVIPRRSLMVVADHTVEDIPRNHMEDLHMEVQVVDNNVGKYHKSHAKLYPNKIVGRFQNKTAITHLVNNVHQLPDKFQNSNVDRYPSKNAKMFQDKSVNLFHANNAETFQDKNAKMYQDNNVKMYQDNNAEMFQDNNAKMYLDNNVEMFQDNNAKMYQGSNVETYHNR